MNTWFTAHWHRIRWGAVALIICANAWISALPVNAQGAIQVFGESDASNLGLQADVAMCNPSNTDGHWVVGPVGTKNSAQSVYIESGPSRYYNSNDGNIHPYGSGKSASGYQSGAVATGTNLANCGNYHVYTNNTGGNGWQSVFCSGSGCQQMWTIDAGQGALDTITSGGEASDSAGHWGTIYVRNNGFFPNGGSSYVPWCYSRTLINGTSNAPTACYNAGDGYNDSWDAGY